MTQPNRSGALVLGASILLGLSSLGYLLGHAAVSVKSLERTVTVKGLSEREVAANVVAWPITFQVADNDLGAVYKSIEDKTAIVRTFLSGYGITGEEMSLSPPSVTDLFAQQWGDKSQIRFRYTGSASVTVHSENVAAVRKAMSNVLELGLKGVVVTVSPGPNRGPAEFSFTRLNELKPEMVEEATKNARAVAEKFAADSNSRLGKIKTARQGQFSIQSRDSTTPQIKKIRVVSTIEYYLAD